MSISDEDSDGEGHSIEPWATVNRGRHLTFTRANYDGILDDEA